MSQPASRCHALVRTAQQAHTHQPKFFFLLPCCVAPADALAPGARPRRAQRAVLSANQRLVRGRRSVQQLLLACGAYLSRPCVTNCFAHGRSAFKVARRVGYALFGVLNGTEVNPDFSAGWCWRCVGVVCVCASIAAVAQLADWCCCSSEGRRLHARASAAAVPLQTCRHCCRRSRAISSSSSSS